METNSATPELAGGVATVPAEEEPKLEVLAPEDATCRFGIVFGMPEQQYRSSEGIAQSALKEMDLSPAHYRVAAEHGVPEEGGGSEPGEEPSEEEATDERRKALDFGTAFHTAVLEPQEFERHYHLVPPEMNLRSNAGKAWKKALLAQGDEIIKPRDLLRIEAMAANLRDHPVAALALAESRREVAVYAPLSVGGVVLQRKGRVDLMANSGVALADIKTCRYGSGHPEEWGKQVGKCFYHMQGAYYLDIVNSVIGTEQFTEFVHLVVEKEPPFAVAAYRLTREALDAGRSLYNLLLARVAECTRDDSWPAYPTHLMPVDLPRWKTAKIIDPLDL